MVMPLPNHTPFKGRTPPYAMWLLIVANIIVFVVQVHVGPEQMSQVDHIAGVIPVALTRDALLADFGRWSP
jgi:hypothetical protein